MNTYRYAVDGDGRTHLYEAGGDGRDFTFCISIEGWWPMDPQPSYDVVPSCPECQRVSVRREALDEWHRVGEPHDRHEGCDGVSREGGQACTRCGGCVTLVRSQDRYRPNEWVTERHFNPWGQFCQGSGIHT